MSRGFSLWTPSQRTALIVFLVGLWVYLGYRYFSSPLHVPDPQPPEALRAAELEDRIDPNRAEWQMLASLPLIGERRARDIVAYREAFVANHRGPLAFARLEDLMNVRGIGTATISQLEPYLIFPAPPREFSTTQAVE